MSLEPWIGILAYDFADCVGEIVWQEDNCFLGRIGTDFLEGLEGADIETARSLGEHMGSFSDSSSGGFFAFGGDDGGAAFAFGFGLFGHGAFHVRRELNVLKFNVFDIDTPFVGLGVDDFANLDGDFVALAKDLIKVEITGDVAEGGLSESAGRVGVIRGFKNSLRGVDDAEIDDSVDIDGDVVAGDDFLLRDVHRGGADVDFCHVVDVGDDDAEAGLQHAGIFTEAEDNAALVLIDDADAGDDD